MTIAHIEKRTSHALDNHPVPPMTDPDGRYWDQPPRERITIDDTHALMTLADFKALSEYSCSQPSGVYVGKMWKRHDGIYDREYIARGGKAIWCLCWYDFSTLSADICSIRLRYILLADADIDTIGDKG